ncbi:phosphoribosylaminoimidazolesuccinocarboxamide synthase [Alteromonas sp. ASW11-130]|uniref:phosphoribosylaminoimidazolesuccinocarboxamide synthase n=1 Tax=Alteromonas sp. ASW11-130 TaxID=3015775 RepID=UPI002241D35C|nr:phosphoribosylaminoimidazolesuccinocarboxamide synthase [Alteromonas sp. ASW11-130]MCW8091146.1 hypothetical protein [Alteromonas sp. ASW11-130]
MTIAKQPISLRPEVDYLLGTCAEFGLDVDFIKQDKPSGIIELLGPSDESLIVDPTKSDSNMFSQLLAQLRIDFKSLPLLVLGDSKEIRLLTPKIALARLLPTVYSYTFNRYGTIPETDTIRAKFSAQVFRHMALSPGARHISTAFLGLLHDDKGPLLAEQVVQTCNLEVRVKRYHIGSPLHRYKYMEKHNTAFGKPPLQRWRRFDNPLVCFDWRHPLKDEKGNRLADEPLPDDYAAMWIEDVNKAKAVARDAFLWLEERFEKAGLRLVDICFFIDRSGSVLFGEISPDCMRVRDGSSANAQALDKDVWRSGGSAEEVVIRYQQLYDLVFGSQCIEDPRQPIPIQ